MVTVNDVPLELAIGIREFWTPDQWDNAAGIAALENPNFDPFAVVDTTDAEHPCGAFLRTVGGVAIFAERSVGYFQINTCFFPGWEWQRLYNARHNAGTAHLIYTRQGWSAWYFSALKLGLI